jgi:hypothetical protein
MKNKMFYVGKVMMLALGLGTAAILGCKGPQGDPGVSTGTPSKVYQGAITVPGMIIDINPWASNYILQVYYSTDLLPSGTGTWKEVGGYVNDLSTDPGYRLNQYIGVNNEVLASVRFFNFPVGGTYRIVVAQTIPGAPRLGSRLLD